MDLNLILDRNDIIKDIKDFLINFESNKKNELTKRCIYLYGYPGIGKTTMVRQILNEMNYDIIQFDASDIRNKSMIEMLNTHNVADNNIVSIFQREKKKLIILMDEIDCMNNGDKGGINSLIKLIRPKKTKKQKADYTTHVPIICIGNNFIDKKIKELMKCCLTIELSKPTNKQMAIICKQILPSISKSTIDVLCTLVSGDIKRLMNIIHIIQTNKMSDKMISLIFEKKTINEDTKKITKKIMNHYVSLNEHLTIMNEMDRTIIAMLWHENIIDLLEKIPKEKAIQIYSELLENICYADYIDKITFQKQIWQFNEMSSIIKTLYTNYIFHTNIDAHPKIQDIRFTKTLTKYSTEYNNDVFIQNLCQQLNLDKKDLYSYVNYLKNHYTIDEIIILLQKYEISVLDVNRLFRYIEISS
jgi:DNA polymerase III delta prime subunit